MQVHVISHTHWDREWYLTFEQYRVRLVELIDGVLDRMAADPAFTFFHLDGQTVVLEDYLAVRPEREAELRGRVEEGRLLIGPWYVMPDMFLVSGEALVRNLALGLRIATAFGGAMRVGYMPDPFGHVAQMPQILAGFGLEGAILWRGFGGRKAEYWWESPDGTRALLLHLPPEGYCNGLRLPLLEPDSMRREAAALVDRERARAASGQALVMVGVDHVEPHPELPRVLGALGDLENTSPQLSTLPAYVRAVGGAIATAGEGLEVVRGELRAGEEYAHLLPGVLSARTYLKQANARAQRELEWWAEPATAFALLAGEPVPPGLLDYAWRTLLQNHPHDSICGCSIDEVHEENVTRFARVQQAAEAVTARALRAVGSRVPPAARDAVRGLVVNTGRAAWSGVLRCAIDIPLEPVGGGRDTDIAALESPLTLHGPDARLGTVRDHLGRDRPFQVLSTADVVRHFMSRYVPPVALRVRRVDVAVDVEAVPGLGYAALDFHVTGAATEGHDVEPVSDSRSIENDLVRLDVAGHGRIDVLLKETGRRYEGVFALEDTGDVGDEYTYAPPAADLRVTSADAREVSVTAIDRGPLSFGLRLSMTLPVPQAASDDRRSRARGVLPLPVSMDLRLTAGSSAVECVLRVDNHACDHRLRLLFPTGAPDVGHHRADTAFAVVRRPVARQAPPEPLVESPVSTAPLHSVVDAGDDSTGAVVVADGLCEYEVVPGDNGAAIALTLLRAVGDLSRDDLGTRKGHAGPALSTPGAQCRGPHAFRCAFIPRTAPPSEDELLRTARAVLSPPRLYAPAGGDGRLPAARSFLDIEGDPGVVLSASAPSGTGRSLLLRIFNVLERPARASIRVPETVQHVHLTDLAGVRRQPCRVDEGRIHLSLGAHRIQTIELALSDPPGEIGRPSGS